MLVSPIQAYNCVSFKGEGRTYDYNKGSEKIYEAIRQQKLHQPKYYYNPKYSLDTLVQEDGKVNPFNLKACGMIFEDLNKIIKEEISSEATNKYPDDILALKYNIAKECISTTKALTGKNYETGDIYGLYLCVKNKVDENKDELNACYKAPLNKTGGKAVRIEDYMLQHPNSSYNEILDSSLYKIYYLIKNGN